MELTVRTKRVSAGNRLCRFAALRQQLARRVKDVAWAVLDAVQAPDEVEDRRRREQEIYGVIGLGGRGLFT